MSFFVSWQMRKYSYTWGESKCEMLIGQIWDAHMTLESEEPSHLYSHEHEWLSESWEQRDPDKERAYNSFEKFHNSQKEPVVKWFIMSISSKVNTDLEDPKEDGLGNTNSGYFRKSQGHIQNYSHYLKFTDLSIWDLNILLMHILLLEETISKTE